MQGTDGRAVTLVWWSTPSKGALAKRLSTSGQNLDPLGHMGQQQPGMHQVEGARGRLLDTDVMPEHLHSNAACRHPCEIHRPCVQTLAGMVNHERRRPLILMTTAVDEHAVGQIEGERHYRPAPHLVRLKIQRSSMLVSGQSYLSWEFRGAEVTAPSEALIRAAALTWLDQMSQGGEIPLSRDQLANDFNVDGARFPLIDRGRGIRKPAGWAAALSITTSVAKSGRPAIYDDSEGADGLHRYKLRRDERGESENAGLRIALLHDLPLAWFFGLQPGLFQVISPVYLREEEPLLSQFSLALTEPQRMVQPGSIVEERVRRYLMRQTRERLHQPVFASQVMIAYAEHCAVCSLNHRELLDAAHIIADTKPNGLPIVSNGLALCKIHHAAFDCNILGIRPDYVVQIHERLLNEIDGPMLLHGLQGRHGQGLMTLPKRLADRPDPIRLEERYVEFKAA